MQKNIGKCPLTDLEVICYDRTDGAGMGVARRNLDGIYYYLSSELKWISSGSASGIYKTFEETQQAFNEYTRKIFSLAVIPREIDQTNLRFSFKCPHCDLVHKDQMKFSGWEQVTSVIERHCPKNPNGPIWIVIWRGKNINFSAPLTIINPLPYYSCRECYGSGEFTLFTSKSPCSLCLPKKKV